MRHRAAAAGLLAMAAAGAQAGGVDRSGQPVAPLFEEGNYLEFSFRSVNPSVSGTQLLVFPPSVTGSESGDLARGYGYAGAALKFAVADEVDVALIYEEPYGASIAYPSFLTTGYFAGSSVANLRSDSFSAIGRYKFSDKISAYGGVRYQSLNAAATIPFIPPTGYAGTTDTDYSFGYLVGAAYEKPDIAMRVALTYFSRVTHDLLTTETSALGAGNVSTMTVETPQAVNLDVQTGVAPGTLVFGGVRWVNWSEFAIPPADYVTLTGQPLVSFEDDTWTYTLGVGRQLNDTWAVAASAVHEPQTGGLRSNLNPSDGYNAVGVGVTYTHDGFKLQAGVQHIWIGDATTRGFGGPGGQFEGNTAVAFGMKTGFSF